LKKLFSVMLLMLLTSTLTLAFNVQLASTTNSDWCEIGVPYRAVDGLTVTLDSFTIVEKTGSYQYMITYTLKNENPDEAIDEGSFKMYYKHESGGLPQYGFFGKLFPGDTKTRSYTFEELKSKLFDVLEYHHDNFFSKEPLEDSLKWKVVYPDNTPPITEHDYDGAWRKSDFTITLTATDNINRIEETYYRINDGPVKKVSVDGQPCITTEGANNTLEYWSADTVGNEEFPHKILTGIKLDKTAPMIEIPFRMPENDVEPDQEVKVLVNVTDFVSGVKIVALYYTNDTIWRSVPMAFNTTSALWEAIIPGHVEGTQVKYRIEAYDNAENVAVEDDAGQCYTYTVIPEFPSVTMLLLLLIFSSFVIALMKRRPKKI